MPEVVCEKKCTLRVNKRQGEPEQRLDIFLEFIHRNDMQNGIKGVQPAGNGCYYITFEIPRLRDEFIDKYRTFAFRDTNYDCQVAGNVTRGDQDKPTFVYVMDLPLEMKKEEICDKLKGNGNITDHQFMTVKNFPGIYNGTRKITFAPLVKEIPMTIFLKGMKARVRYEGQEIQCHKCSQKGHMAKDCTEADQNAQYLKEMAKIQREKDKEEEREKKRKENFEKYLKEQNQSGKDKKEKEPWGGRLEGWGAVPQRSNKTYDAATVETEFEIETQNKYETLSVEEGLIEDENIEIEIVEHKMDKIIELKIRDLIDSAPENKKTKQDQSTKTNSTHHKEQLAINQGPSNIEKEKTIVQESEIPRQDKERKEKETKKRGKNVEKPKKPEKPPKIEKEKMWKASPEAKKLNPLRAVARMKTDDGKRKTPETPVTEMEVESKLARETSPQYTQTQK